jgi:hypothetical protein
MCGVELSAGLAFELLICWRVTVIRLSARMRFGGTVRDQFSGLADGLISKISGCLVDFYLVDGIT